MNSKITHILLLLLTLAACNKDNTTTTSDSLSGIWKLVRYHNLTIGRIETEPSNISRSIIIHFSDNGVKGTMSGHTVTNTVSGEYELLPGNKMNTLSFGGTKVGEPDWGHEFWDAIHTASSYDRQGDKLYIYFNSDTGRMEFNRQ